MSGQRSDVLDPLGAIHLMENHDRAYHLWREAGLHDRILVHIDAHHDMWWTEDERLPSIANFICPALKGNIVREAWWIVPDATWDTAAGRAALCSHLKTIQERYPGAPASTRWEERSIRTTVMGRSLVICSLTALTAPAEDVLLDIDADYLMIPSVSYGEWDRHSPLPWRWPAELVEVLQTKRVRSDFVTIAYSVEGGHTPIQWKYLGDELASRLRRPEGGDAHQAYELMRIGAVAQYRGDHIQAETAFRHAGEKLGAASYFCLAHILAEQRRIEEARRSYARALALDPTFRSAYSSPGVPLYFARSYGAAERAFSRTLLLDPSDASAHLGLGWLAARRKRWVEAEERARASLARQPDLIDAHRLLGAALEAQGQLAAAIDAYEHSLQLALAGHTPFNGVIVSDPDRDSLLDSDHARVHAKVARLCERSGDRKRAVAGYGIAIAGGYDNASIRLRLARLYVRQRRWADARRHAAAGLKIVPRAVRTTAVRFRRRISERRNESR